MKTSLKKFKVFIFIESKFHLLSPTNQHGCKETQGHSQLVDKRLVVCDVSERKKKSVPSLHRTQHSLNLEGRIQETLTYTKDIQNFPEQALESKIKTIDFIVP